MKPKLTVCVLTYGDYLPLARRVIGSILEHCPRAEYNLVVGANAVGSKTLDYLQSLVESRAVGRLLVSQVNLNKNPMMRQMFEGIETDYIWWFDDDSYVLGPEAFVNWLGAADAAPANTVTWGRMASCSGEVGFTDVPDAAAFVRGASWYRGLPPPSWRLGGKGEFDFRGCGCGDGRWEFLVGGCFLIRTSAIRTMNWPDPRLRKMGEDVFLGEAVRQQGWRIAHIMRSAVVINDQAGRGDPGSPVWSEAVSIA